MNIINITGDITDIRNYDPKDLVVICHQTNVLGVMGAGVSVSIKEAFPIIYDVYKKHCVSFSDNPEKLLGQVQIFSTQHSSRAIFVANLFGQSDFGTYQRQTNYEAIYSCLETLRSRLKERKTTVAFPVGMSSGLAGGNWNIIYTMITEVFKDTPHTLMFVTYDKN